ncbi:hypothetical protein, partial [Aeromonas caviae]|uniref:hypothetical protein n=1 Tax=Aeromonas caviae TaxID=648 RepID=UPI002B48FDB3
IRVFTLAGMAVQLRRNTQPPHPVEVSVYSSPYGGYIRVSEMDVHNENAAAFTSALMSADECRALARSLDAMASVLEQSEKNGDMS